MEKRKYKTKKEKQVLVDNYLESGLSRKAWCGKNNIPISTLVGWQKQLNRISKDEVIFISPKQSASKDKVSDVELAAFTTILEIKECKLHINENIPFHFISQLIKAVREAHV